MDKIIRKKYIGVGFLVLSILLFFGMMLLQDGMWAFLCCLFGVYSFGFGIYFCIKNKTTLGEYIKSFFKVFILFDSFYYEVKDDSDIPQDEDLE